eukprot:g19569.t1
MAVQMQMKTKSGTGPGADAAAKDLKDVQLLEPETWALLCCMHSEKTQTRVELAPKDFAKVRFVHRLGRFSGEGPFLFDVAKLNAFAAYGVRKKDGGKTPARPPGENGLEKIWARDAKWVASHFGISETLAEEKIASIANEPRLKKRSRLCRALRLN